MRWCIIMHEDDLLQCTKGRLSSHGSSEFSTNAQDVSADNFSPSSTRKGPISSFPIIPSKITTLLTPYTHRAIITSFSNAIKTNFHVRLHVFSRPFHAQTFVPRCHRRSFNHTFGQSHSRLGVAFAIFGSPDFF